MGRGATLDEIALTEIFQLVSASDATGGMLIRNDDYMATVNFHCGEIVYAGVEDFKVKLGERLKLHSFIQQHQIDQALRFQQAQKPWQPLGKICLREGYIREEELEIVLHEQIFEMVMTLFSWNDGKFKFEQGQVAISDEISLPLFTLWEIRSPSQLQSLPSIRCTTEDIQLPEVTQRWEHDDRQPWFDEFFKEDQQRKRFLQATEFVAAVEKNGWVLPIPNFVRAFQKTIEEECNGGYWVAIKGVDGTAALCSQPHEKNLDCAVLDENSWQERANEAPIVKLSQSLGQFCMGTIESSPASQKLELLEAMLELYLNAFHTKMYRA